MASKEPRTSSSSIPDHNHADLQWLDFLRAIDASESQIAAFRRDDMESIDLIFDCTEDELKEHFYFTLRQLVLLRGRRRARVATTDGDLRPLAGPREAQTRSLGEVTRNLPTFRGTMPGTHLEADTFIVRFETVLRTLEVPEAKWASFLTMQLHDNFDAQYWAQVLSDHTHPGSEWSKYKEIFLGHFRHPRLAEAKREELAKFQQKPGERMQQYSDRFMGVLSLTKLEKGELSLVVDYYRRGITDKGLRNGIANRESVHEPFTLKSITDTALFVESQLDAERDFSSAHKAQGSKPPDVHERTPCVHCGSVYHRAFRCPKKGQETQQEILQICKICRELTSHRYWVCPKAECNTCHRLGHIAPNCPDASCTKCGQKGHTDARCPTNKPKKPYTIETFLNNLRKGEVPVALPTLSSIHEIDELLTFKEGVHDLLNYFKEPREEIVRVRAIRVDQTNVTNQTLIPIWIQNRPVIALVDHGSSHSFLSKQFANELGLSGRRISLAAQSAFTSLASVAVEASPQLTVTCGLKEVDHEFLIAEIHDMVILGSDILPKCGIGLTGLPTQFPGLERASEGPSSSSSSSSSSTAEIPRDLSDGILSDPDQIDNIDELMKGISDLLEENSRLDPTGFCTFPAAVVELNTGTAAPVFVSQYKTPFSSVSAVDEQVGEWARNHRIVPSNPLSRWNSPLLTAPKKDLLGNKTDLRVCLDVRRINELLPQDNYGIPRIKDLFARVQGFSICSGLDLASAYTQFPIQESDTEKTTFTWRSKKWKFQGAPFGFTHLPAHFQRVFGAMLYECRDYIVVYLDDVFIFSANLEEHIKHLREVIRILNQWHLILKPSKCAFGFTKLKLLGHIISGSCVEIDPRKVSTFQAIPTPTTGKQIQSFLGFASYLRDYIPGYATIAAPLERIKNMKILGSAWSPQCQESIDILKNVLSNAPAISMYNPDHPLMVACDASLYGIGSVLYQEYGGQVHYLSFYSKALNAAQRNYPATKRELLAIVYSLKAFRQWIYGNRFTLFSDHKALMYLFSQKEPTYMTLNWADELLEYDFQIVHRPGIEMILPDSLSRLYYQIKRERGGNEPDKSPVIVCRATYVKCKECKRRVHRLCATGCCTNHCKGCTIHPQVEGEDILELETELLPVEQVDLPKGDGISFERFATDFLQKKAPVDDENARQLIDQKHALLHQGARGIQKLLWSDGWYWPKMLDDIRKVCDACQSCLRFNLVRNGFHPLKVIKATYPLDHICMDLFTLNQSSRSGMNYVMVITDIATRFSFLHPLPDKSALSAARGFYLFMTTLGVPKIVQTDNGTEFNLILKAIKDEMGFDGRTITPYYPQSNGCAEAHVKLAKSLLIKLAEDRLDEWDLFLPATQLAINSRVTKRTKSSPFSLMFGRPLNPFEDYSEVESNLLSTEELMKRHQVIHELVYPAIRANADASTVEVASDFEANHRILRDGLPVGSYVMKLNKDRTQKTQPHYTGPYKVLRKTTSGTYVLEDSTGNLLPKNATLSELKLISQAANEELGQVEYEVESILNHRDVGNQRSFYVKWRGYVKPTWEPLSNLGNCKKAIEEYLSRKGLLKNKRWHKSRK